MAVTKALDKVKANMVMNTGTSASGTITTANVSIGTLDSSAWDAEKALAIMKKVKNCLSKAMYSAQAVETYTLSESA